MERGAAGMEGRPPERSKEARIMLKVIYAAIPLLAGLDKFMGVLVDWGHYLAPVIANNLPFAVVSFMLVVGVLEIVAGILVLTKWTRMGAFLISGWLVLIAVNLLLAGAHLDIVLRDIGLASGAYALGELAV